MNIEKRKQTMYQNQHLQQSQPTDMPLEPSFEFNNSGKSRKGIERISITEHRTIYRFQNPQYTLQTCIWNNPVSQRSCMIIQKVKCIYIYVVPVLTKQLRKAVHVFTNCFMLRHNLNKPWRSLTTMRRKYSMIKIFSYFVKVH